MALLLYAFGSLTALVQYTWSHGATDSLFSCSPQNDLYVYSTHPSDSKPKPDCPDVMSLTLCMRTFFVLHYHGELKIRMLYA